MSSYIKLNLLPFIIEIVFIISCFIVPEEYFIYTNFLFYLLLLVYFLIKKQLSLKEWIDNLKSGKNFWKQTVASLLFFAAALVLTTALENLFPDLDTGMILLKTGHSLLKLMIFAVSTILLPAAVEETFFRKSLISFKSKKLLIATSLLGMLLYASEHSLTVWGIFLTMIWAVPMNVSYIKTKNIYVTMTAHFIGNALINGIGVIFAVFALL